MYDENLKNLPEIKNKILSFIRMRGPSLPVHVAREIKISMLFTSALLSELLSEKKIKTSNMRVGGSPLYLLSGQESMLDKFHNFLPGKEREAFILLKEKKVLQDDKMLPAIRVAFHNIKDFAKPINFEGKIFWRFFTLEESEVLELIKTKKEKIQRIEIKPEKKELQKKIEIKTRETKPEKKATQQERPLLKLKEPKEKIKKKAKEKSDFVLGVINFIRNKNMEIIEEIKHKKRELIARIRVNSGVGKIEFFSIAKDKKRITENDLALLLQKAQNMKLPALFISSGQLSKKALLYFEAWKNMIKVIELKL